MSTAEYVVVFESQKHIYILPSYQAVVEEIQVKTTDLGKVQSTGHDLMDTVSGNITDFYWSATDHAFKPLPSIFWPIWFRGGGPAGAGEDGCSAYSLFCAQSEQPGCAAKAGSGSRGLQSLYIQPGRPPPVAGSHWEGAPGTSRSADTCWRCRTLYSWETEGIVFPYSTEVRFGVYPCTTWPIKVRVLWIQKKDIHTTVNLVCFVLADIIIITK